MAKIMLVEDDNNLREIYGARLLAEGHEIVAAKDGEEALAMAVKEKPDLIISDVMMPRISGFDMLDILRNAPETKETKVIMMTALSQAEDKARADSLGADRYLVKSQVTLEDVARVVQDVLEGKAAVPSGPATPAEGSVPNPPAPGLAPAPVPAAVGTPSESLQALTPEAPVAPPAVPVPQPATTQPAVPTSEPSPAPISLPEPPTATVPSQPPVSATIPVTEAPQPATPAAAPQATTPDPQSDATVAPAETPVTVSTLPPAPSTELPSEVQPEITPTTPPVVPVPPTLGETVQTEPETPTTTSTPITVNTPEEVPEPPAATPELETTETPLEVTLPPAATTANEASQTVPVMPEPPETAPTEPLIKVELPTPPSDTPPETSSTVPAAADATIEGSGDQVGPSLSEALKFEEQAASPNPEPGTESTVTPAIDVPAPSEETPVSIINGAADVGVVKPTEEPEQPEPPAITTTHESTASSTPKVISENPETRKKVIAPLSDPTQGPDLNALLEAEQEKAPIPPPPANTVIAPVGTEAPATPDTKTDEHNQIAL
jgi:CheY-like chemotaxis protein